MAKEAIWKESVSSCPQIHGGWLGIGRIKLFELKIRNRRSEVPSSGADLKIDICTKLFELYQIFGGFKNNENFIIHGYKK